MEKSKQLRILKVTQLKAIQVSDDSFNFPLAFQTKIILDRKNPSNKKQHQLVYQQGRHYGEVGDFCTYLSNNDLFALEEKGMIKITKAGNLKKSELTKDTLIYFLGEKLPMTIKAINGSFAICTRPLNKRQDADMLHHRVEMDAYTSFTDAYNDLKDEIIYTIIDFKRGIKAPHNLIFGGYDFKKQSDMNKLLKDLMSEETELSERNKADYHLDTERTFKF